MRLGVDCSTLQSTGLQRASGVIDFSIGKDGLKRCFQSGSAKLFLPKTYNPTKEAVLVNTAGGLADGDHFSYSLKACDHSHVTVTTQAAERVYGAAKKSPAKLNIQIDIEPNAIFHWLPQETILFNGARLDRRLNVSMDTMSSFLANEFIVFGRAAMKETVQNGLINDQWRITRGGQLVHAESVFLEGNIASKLSAVASAGNNICLATCLFIAPDVETKLQLAHDFVAQHNKTPIGISVWNGKLVVRFLSKEASEAKCIMSGFLECLRGFEMPRVWNF